MLLNKIISKSFESLIYCERYVNDGSPSGFSEKFNTSPETNPFDRFINFNIPSLIDDETNFEYYGDKNLIHDNRVKFYIHPDMISHKEIMSFSKETNKSIIAYPTSSGRTVLLDFEQPIYVKLHYDGLIGRINRKLIYRKAIAGVEISNEIKSAMQTSTIKSNFLGILEEPLAIIHRNPHLNKELNWGVVFRSFHPTFTTEVKSRFILPFFSLFSKDRNNSDPPILSQLFNLWGELSLTTITNKVLIPIIDIYFELIVKLGLQNEMNAQNILISFDSSFMPNGIILRDFMGFEKDLDIRKQNNLNISFDSEPYKVISSLDKLYIIRHSFAFDFKVSHYIIKPILDYIEIFNKRYASEILNMLRSQTEYWVKALPDNYFPNDGWYSHNKVLLNSKREYIFNRNPLLR